MGERDSDYLVFKTEFDVSAEDCVFFATVAELNDALENVAMKIDESNRNERNFKLLKETVRDLGN